MFVAVIVLASLIGCYLTLGFQVIVMRQLFKGTKAEIVEFIGWPFLILADLVVYILRRLHVDWLHDSYKHLP